jgi:hypothetical protein
MTIRQVTLTETSPSSASTAVGTAINGLQDYEFFRIDAALVGATGGVLDVYLQRKIKDNVWADWLHYTQLTAGGAAVKWTCLAGNPTLSTALTSTFGIGTDASPGVALAANTFLGGHPGYSIRPVYVAGASTSAGASLTFHVTMWKALV